MPTLVYKRTHKGDPRKAGIFGIENCMKRIRGYDFDSVIGIGGIGAWAKREKIDSKINWIGVGAYQVGWCVNGPLLAFEHFRLFEDKGPNAFEVAPLLAKRFCHAKAARSAIHKFTDAEKSEIRRLLASVKNAPPSKVTPASVVCLKCKRKPKCAPKKC